MSKNVSKHKANLLLWKNLLGEYLLGEWKILILIVLLIGTTFFFSDRLVAPLSNSAFLKVLDASGKFGILIAIIAFLREVPKWEKRLLDEAKRRQFEYWKVIDAAKSVEKWDDGRFVSISLRMALEGLAQEKDQNGNRIKIRDVYAMGANLAEIDLTNSNFYFCSFILTNLENADFCKSKLYDVRLNRARLFGANFEGADFQEVGLKYALYNDETRFPEKFDIKGTMAYRIAPGVNLQGAFLENASLWDVNLEKSNLQGADLSNSIIGGIKSNWRYANLQSANLKGVRAALADLRYVNLQNANLQEATLQDAKLDGADLKGADLRGARYITVEQITTAVNWKDAIYDPEFLEELNSRSHQIK